MRVLLTNDDGFYSPGIQVLKNMVSELCWEVWVSAPLKNCSGMSRAISVDFPMETEEVSEREIVVSGTPVDSALVGLHRMMHRGVKPDIVLSGINCGSNVGTNIMYSGTIGAATAAISMGIPSIAISQKYPKNREEISWDNSEKVAMKLVKQLIADSRWDRRSVMSINIPSTEIRGTRFVEQGRYRPHYSIYKSPGKDSRHVVYTIGDLKEEAIPLEHHKKKASNELLEEGYVVVTPVGSDMTDHSTLNLFSE